MNFKNILWLAILLLSITNLSAQINYQATVRDNNNQPFIYQSVNIEVNILQNGTSVYYESHMANTGTMGVVNLSIGSGSNISTNFSNIDWSKGNHQIQLTIDGEILEATTINSVPIAEYAKNSDQWVKSGNTVSLSSSYNLSLKNTFWNHGVKIKMQGEEGVFGEYSFDFPDSKDGKRWQVWSPDYGSVLAVKNNNNVGIGTGSPAYPLHILSDRVNKGLAIQTKGFSAGILLHMAKAGNGTEYGYLHLVGGTKLRGNGITSVFDGKVVVNCLQINGGCDIKEDLNSIEDLEPGDIVVIDEINAGQVKRTSKAYDRKVLGVISGANGVNPGISLSQNDVLEGEYPLTMLGRVYVKVVGTVEIGDMLTTSKKPGFAMAVNDYTNAYGTVIGKAMTANQTEDGMVLVFVNLQ